MKQRSIAYFLFFFLGIIGINLIGQDWLLTYGSMNQYLFKDFCASMIPYEKYFIHVLYLRLKTVFLLFLLSRMFRMRTIVFLSNCFFSFSIGAFMTMTILENGVMGMFKLLCALLPQGIFYFTAYFIWQMPYTRNCNYGMEMSTKSYHTVKYQLRGKRRILRPASYVLIALCLSIGIFLECYVNPYLLEKVIKL